jgi:hypothetical protein
MTHEILTPSFLATSLALTSWRICLPSVATVAKRLPWSLPFGRCIAGFTYHHSDMLFIYTRTANSAKNGRWMLMDYSGRDSNHRMGGWADPDREESVGCD